MAASLGARRARRRLATARWQVHHRGEHGMTMVAVHLMLTDGRTVDEHVVDRFSSCSPDWSERFVQAREQAQERAFHLNADRPAV